MSNPEQNLLAESFVNEQLNNKYGIKGELSAPNNSGVGINKLAHGADSGQVNSHGLELTSNNNIQQGNELYDNANKAMENFKNNQGNIAGEQLMDQAKTGVNVVKNVAQKATDIASETLYDVVHPDEILKK